MNRDGTRKSVWQEEIKRFPPNIPSNTIFDVAIVGGGITGISTAYRLQKAGKRCIVLEARNLGFGTTGGTTAHLNDFFDTSFYDAIRDFGLENAKLFVNCGKDAMQIIDDNIKSLKINCDYERKNAHLFALDDKQAQRLDDIVKAAEKVGYQMRYIPKTSFPIPFTKAVEISNQGQFHPIKYIKALCEAYINLGGILVENCLCTEHEEQDSGITLTTTQGDFHVKKLVYATHIPPGVNILHFMNAPYRSYAMAFTLRNELYPQELGYDLEDAYHYYRTHEINEKKVLIAGGEDHKTGHSEDTGERFSKLENYVRTHFQVDQVLYSWSSQYYESVDGFPYIGVLPGSKGNIYTATGFRGNGMMFGSLSSKIISDLILTGSNIYENLFNPARIKPIAGFNDFVKEQATVISDFVKGKLFTKHIASLGDITEGSAKVVTYEGSNYAIYKEQGGKLHIVKSTCPHAKCEVRWNSAEISWDCPCHGSRFNINGKLLTGPSVKDLQEIKQEDI